MAGNEMSRAAVRLIDFVESLPRKPWEGTGEPQDDKRLIEGRHAAEGAAPAQAAPPSGAKSAPRSF